MKKAFSEFLGAIREKLNQQILVSVFLFLLCLIISIPTLSKPMIGEADAYARSLIVSYHQTEGIWIDKFQNTWLPLHFTILHISVVLYNNIHFSPRFLTLLLSCLTVISLYHYSLIVKKDVTLAFVSGISFIFLPLRFVTATHTLSEPVFVFFLLTFFIFLLKDKPNYFLSLIFLNIAHGIRYESWFLLPLLWLYIFLQNKPGILTKITLILLSLAVPLYWLFINYEIWGNPLNFFTTKQFIASGSQIPQYGNMFLSYQAWETQLINAVPTFGLFTIFLGYLKTIKENKKIITLVTPLYLLLTLVLQVYLKTMEWFPIRYLLIPLVFFMPYFSIGLKELLQSHSYAKYVLPIVFIFFLPFAHYTTLNSYLIDLKDSIADLNSIIFESKKLASDKATFMYVYDDTRLWHDQPYKYFLLGTEIHVTHVSQLNALELNSSNYVVGEKTTAKLLQEENKFNLLYQNNSFSLWQPKAHGILLPRDLTK